MSDRALAAIIGIVLILAGCGALMAIGAWPSWADVVQGWSSMLDELRVLRPFFRAIGAGLLFFGGLLALAFGAFFLFLAMLPIDREEPSDDAES